MPHGPALPVGSVSTIRATMSKQIERALDRLSKLPGVTRRIVGKYQAAHQLASFASAS